jgi:aminomethyltransferase
MASSGPQSRADMSTRQRRTPLLDVHHELGARLVDFAGWDMPLQYEGVIAEHNAVRTAVGLFDVSHLGKVLISASGGALQRSVTADVEAMEVGTAKYALVLTEEGGCIDDVFVYRLGRDDWLVVPNAANVSAVCAAISDAGGEPVDAWDRWAILALQGPDSIDLFENAWPGRGASEMKLHTFRSFELEGAETVVARTGYTGERGFELYVPAATSAEVFRKLLHLGAKPAGLGARDTLRLEMGYALYGHELTRDVNPLEAGLGWVLAWDSPFRGRDALLAVKERGVDRKLFGVRCTGRGIPRQGCPVNKAGQRVGELTSGNYSPTLRTGIGLSLGAVATLPQVGDRVEVEARGRIIEGDIVKPPFIRGQTA